MKKVNKPLKKTDKELNDLIINKVASSAYIFLKHAKQRLKDRNVLDTDVLNLLENKKGYKRKRNKSKDKYEEGKHDWNYCFEGYDCNNEQIRIIISFDSNFLLIITVIKLDR